MSLHHGTEDKGSSYSHSILVSRVSSHGGTEDKGHGKKKPSYLLLLQSSITKGNLRKREFTWTHSSESTTVEQKARPQVTGMVAGAAREKTTSSMANTKQRNG